MANKQTFLTQEAYDKYSEEYEYLVNEKRGEIAQKIEVARSYGDLSENSEYDEAKNEQAITESRISQLESLLKHAVIRSAFDQGTEHIQLFSKVKIHDYDLDEDMTYQIVSTKEADPFDGKLSDESPVGQALLGHQVGDEVDEALVHAEHHGHGAAADARNDVGQAEHDAGDEVVEMMKHVLPPENMK